MSGRQTLQTVPKFDIYGLFHLTRQLLPDVRRNTPPDFHLRSHTHHYVHSHSFLGILNFPSLVGMIISYSVIL